MDRHELARRMEALPERFADRIDADVLYWIKATRDGGAWAVMAEDLIRTLLRNGAWITAAERDELHALLEATGRPIEWLNRIKVADD